MVVALERLEAAGTYPPKRCFSRPCLKMSISVWEAIMVRLPLFWAEEEEAARRSRSSQGGAGRWRQRMVVAAA